MTPRADSNNDTPTRKGDPEQRVGGFAFYLSLLALTPTSIIFLALTLPRVSKADPATLSIFAITTILGAAFAQYGIRGHISVLIHEFKHSLVSNFAGNRHKGMEIHEDSGHYEYTYTKLTAHYNALISLAPYIAPVFTGIALGLGALFLRANALLYTGLVGFGFGIDLVLNLRDISPIQTDISTIRGGYWVGILYIAVWNLTILALVLAWVFQGVHGLTLLLDNLGELIYRVGGALSGTIEQ
jgi:hypothetical protein